jgi:hypothetical protein
MPRDVACTCSDRRMQATAQDQYLPYGALRLAVDDSDVRHRPSLRHRRSVVWLHCVGYGASLATSCTLNRCRVAAFACAGKAENENCPGLPSKAFLKMIRSSLDETWKTTVFGDWPVGGLDSRPWAAPWRVAGGWQAILRSTDRSECSWGRRRSKSTRSHRGSWTRTSWSWARTKRRRPSRMRLVRSLDSVGPVRSIYAERNEALAASPHVDRSRVPRVRWRDCGPHLAQRRRAHAGRRRGEVAGRGRPRAVRENTGGLWDRGVSRTSDPGPLRLGSFCAPGGRSEPS